MSQTKATLLGDAFSTGASGSIPVGGIILWSGTIANIANLSGWELCDGTNGTPDLRDRFVLGAHSDGANAGYPNEQPGASDGSADATLPSHTHGGGTLTAADHRHIYPGDDHLAFANNYAGWSAEYSGDTFPMDADSQYGGSSRMWYTTYSGALSVSGSTGSEGESATNANLPPYYALAYIMRVS